MDGNIGEMSDRPLLDPEEIRYRAAKPTYVRGEGYYENEAIFATIQRGNEIEAWCEGSRDNVYRVHAMLAENGNILETSCTCDYSYPGDCKHVVALLLTYLRKPKRFEPLPPIEDALKELSKEDLILLIRQ